MATIMTGLALAAQAAQAATILGDWGTPIPLATGTAGTHPGMVVDTATNTIYTVYASGGAVYSRAVEMPSGTLGPAVQILATGSSPSIAIDPAGNLHVAAYDTTATNLVYARSSTAGASWATATIDGAANHGSVTSITLDPANRIHIGYRGQNGTTDGTLTGKGNPGSDFYDLWYTRFNGDATTGDTTNPTNWDSPTVLVQSSRLTDGRSFIMLGTNMQNLDIEADATNVWLLRREGANSETQDGGYFFFRGVTAPAGTPFTASSGSPFGAGAAWAATMYGQFELREDGTPYRVTWDRMQRWIAPGTYDGLVGVPYDATGSPVDTDPGAAGYQAYGIDTGLHSDVWWQVGQRMDLVIDVNDAYHALYHDNDSPNLGLKYAFSLDGVSWSTEFVSGGGSYSGDNRIAYDPLVSDGMGQVYLLSNSGGNLTLFYREARMIPEPATAAVLAVAGLLALRRRR